MSFYHRNSERKRIPHDYRRQEEEVVGSLCSRQIWKWDMKLVASCKMVSEKWEIVNPDQDNGTKLLYCNRSWTSDKNFELI
ncbi:hypothetical protein TNCV_4694281 [Trichonephila clavipes]|uniref:Uncharacterized protein n=1 Tax=Trichonephila clavipes TaxID=2585209 RepID=A0A8X6WB74_TRICX|nr:hypothetical protein TNCV_4694281 [Trichonephila clavipes]